MISLLVSFVLASFVQASVKLPSLGNFNDYKAAKYSGCWGYTAPDGREYALLGVRTGTSIVDITDAPQLKEIAFIPSVKNTWKEIKTYKNYAYVTTEGDQGLQIIDLSDLPRSAQLAVTSKVFKSAHNLYVDDEAGVLYATGGEAESVRIFSLADPLKPIQTAMMDSPNYVHDIFVRKGRAYLSEMFIGSFAIFEVSNISDPKLVKRQKVPNAGLVHNAWLTHDDRYLMTTEETSGKTVKFWDLENLNDIKMVSEYLGPSKLAHNTHIKGNFAYISHYGSELRIVDVSDPLHPIEAASFDKNSLDETEFVGAWGAYPYFKSGKVVISDIEDGLYVVQFEGGRE